MTVPAACCLRDPGTQKKEGATIYVFKNAAFTTASAASMLAAPDPPKHIESAAQTASEMSFA